MAAKVGDQHIAGNGLSKVEYLSCSNVGGDCSLVVVDFIDRNENSEQKDYTT